MHHFGFGDEGLGIRVYSWFFAHSHIKMKNLCLRAAIEIASSCNVLKLRCAVYVLCHVWPMERAAEYTKQTGVTWHHRLVLLCQTHPNSPRG